MSCLDRARDPIDLVSAAVDAAVGVIEHAILGEYLVDDRAPARGIVLTEDVENCVLVRSKYCWTLAASLIHADDT